MPLYEYICRKCGSIYETIEQSDVVGIGKDCDACGKFSCHKRIMSAPSFKINGASEANGYTIQKGSKDL